MTPEILDLLFPNPLPSRAEIEARYPPRELKPEQKVMRFGPSPTGLVHIGNIYAALLAERVAHQSGGIFYFRIEDTDQKRQVAGAHALIIDALARYGLKADEGVDGSGRDFGPYAPYTQSLRRDIYQAYLKELARQGLVYPCFCTPEDLDVMRKVQEKQGVRPGYYGKYACCRALTDAQVLKALQEGKPYVLRFRSAGDYEKRIAVRDLIKGELSLPENDLDIVVMKSDGLPTYHFAHVADDHLMGTTHATRGDEWLSSTTLHIQLFRALGWEPPHYGHFAALQKLDNGHKRKLSKRHDPEANIAYFWERGYPERAVVEYLLNLINAAFEDWRKANPQADALDFPMNFGKISNTGGALFDFQKLNSISKDVIAQMSAEAVYEAALAWAQTYRPAFAQRMAQQKDYLIQIFAIERGIGAKSRKDWEKWEDIEQDIAYFFDDAGAPPDEKRALLASLNWADVQRIAQAYGEIYAEADGKDTWFDKIKALAAQSGFAAEMKAYRENPAAYKGNVSDVAKILRVLITGRDKSPDLFAIMQILGAARVKRRLAAAG